MHGACSPWIKLLFTRSPLPPMNCWCFLCGTELEQTLFQEEKTVRCFLRTAAAHVDRSRDQRRLFECSSPDVHGTVLCAPDKDGGTFEESTVLRISCGAHVQPKFYDCSTKHTGYYGPRASPDLQLEVPPQY
ncbi:hypothetical protein GQ55_3G291600 [Panicum hallii var. hallii]|uniref:Uncharacterized protein n=1 Tax=Panicum hallii var. hallii TaxID=1504633 RepID=A0A2T7EEI0_9POAL|nr:hypothetical protein GQ55_3G291600 [Panicum hallii var. hallii]